MKLMNDFLEKKLISLKVKRYLEKNKSIANYQPYVLSNQIIYISGQLPLTKIGIKCEGKIMEDFKINDLKNAIEITTSNLFWNLSDCLNEIDDKVDNVKCCSIKGYFNCEDKFRDHSKLLDFSSDLIVKVLGDLGKHSRVAIGVSSLPLNSPVEIEAIFSIS